MASGFKTSVFQTKNVTLYHQKYFLKSYEQMKAIFVYTTVPYVLAHLSLGKIFCNLRYSDELANIKLTIAGV